VRGGDPWIEWERRTHAHAQKKILPWTSEQSRALKEFIQQEEMEREALGLDLLSHSEIGRRAVAKLGLAALGKRRLEAVRKRVHEICNGIVNTNRKQPQCTWTLTQMRAFKEFVRRERMRVEEHLHEYELTRRAITQLTSVMSRRSFGPVRSKIRLMQKRD